MSAEMDCESLLLDDDVPGKCSDGSDFGDMCNVDEDALLADDDALVTTKPPAKSRIRSHVKYEKGKRVEQESEDVLDIGNVEVELDDFDSPNKNSVGLMTVSSTTSANPRLSVSRDEDEEQERETRFKPERHITTSKKYADIPDSLDDVVVPSSHNQQRNQKPFRGRGRGGYNNNLRNKPEGKKVLINPHFKGKTNIPNNNRGSWDARHKLNHNSRNQSGPAPLFMQQSFNHTDNTWNNAQNLPVHQVSSQPFQPYMQPQIPQHQMYGPPSPMPMQHPQVHQQYSQFQPSQQCYIQPMDSFYSQTPQFHQVPQFNQHQSQFQPNQYPPDHNQYPGRMMQFNNPQFVVPQNQIIHQPDAYGQQNFNPHVQQQNIMFNQMTPNNLQDNNSQNSFQMSNLKRKTINTGVMRKNKKRNQVVSKNLHEVRTVQTPDTTVKDDEDDATREYRKQIEEQKRQRELLLQQKEERRRKAIQLEQGKETVTAVQQPKLPVIMAKTTPTQTQPVSQRIVQSNPNIVNVPIRKVTPKPVANPNIKVVKISNEPNVDKQHLSSFLTNRKILAKDESLLDTNIVLISNLANGTTAVKLHKMCVGIGDVKNLHMSPKERQATIQFNSVASAHAFFKKYRRTMLDLSVIHVTLKPMS